MKFFTNKDTALKNFCTNTKDTESSRFNISYYQCGNISSDCRGYFDEFGYSLVYTEYYESGKEKYTETLRYDVKDGTEDIEVRHYYDEGHISLVDRLIAIGALDKNFKTLIG